MLESLEERLTPSGGNPTVTQTAGSYTALTAAVAADTATNTSYVLQITNNFAFSSGGQVTISKLGTGSTLTIEGQNGTNYTLTGNGNRLFTVASGENVTFKDLTLTGGTGGTLTNNLGTAQVGGAILIQGGQDGIVTLSDAIIRGNSVEGSLAEGGGVFMSGGSNLIIQGGSTIQSNHAIGTKTKGFLSTNLGEARGGGLYILGVSGVAIIDSTINNNSAQGGQGADGTPSAKATYADGQSGGVGSGGGLYVVSSGVTLSGDMISGNRAIGGNGGNGAAGTNASSKNSSGGNGGSGGGGGSARGGGAVFHSPSHVNILNDPNHPSIIVDNAAQGGTGGSGGAGGTSTGTANNSNGGAGGNAGSAQSGAVYLDLWLSSGNADIGDTTLYANKAIGGNGGAVGVAGTGGSGTPGKAGVGSRGGDADGGGLYFDPSYAFPFATGGSFTLFNSTVANNTATGGTGTGGATQGGASGGGIDLSVRRGEGLSGLVGSVPTPLEEGG